MKVITVGFSRASGKFVPFSWLIMLAQKTKYSHAYIKYYDPEIDRTMIIQASGLSVNEVTQAAFNLKEIVFAEFQFQIPDANFLKMQQFCADNLGKPYGLLSVFGMAAVILCGWVGIRIHNPFKEVGQTYVCSQLAAAVLEDLNIQLPISLDDVTPADLYPLVAALPNQIDSNTKN